MESKIKVNSILFVVLIFIQLILGLLDLTTWWAFTIPVFLLGGGCFLSGLKAPFFTLGFISGFLIWSGTNLFIDFLSDGQLINSVAVVLMLNKAGTLIVSGVLGGVITGLAFYAGSQAVRAVEEI